MIVTIRERRSVRSLLWLTFLAFACATPAAIAGAGGDGEVVIGGQDTTVDAEDGRDAKFDRNTELPSGIVIDYLSWNKTTNNTFFQITARDVSQRDEQFGLRGGVNDNIRFRANYQSLPYRYGSGAKFLLGRGANDMWGPTYRIADFSQLMFEDPNGNAIPFFTDAAETAADNGLVFGLTNDLLAGANRFALESRRRNGGAGVTIRASDHWTLDFDVIAETRDGTQALGTGTYQRITDVNGDGTTDYDYFFSVRGIEMPAIMDYRTTRYEARASYREQRWFADIHGQVQEFENAFVGLTYDNPFWFNGVDATSGSRRGLWEFGRASYEPSNEAWDMTVTGGVDLPHRTRITAAVSFGEHTQDAPILPISTNPANIATVDINRDSVIDASDDPTVAAVPGLPATVGGLRTLGTSLNASSDVMSYYLQVTSRPAPKLALTGRYRNYEYQGQEGILLVPARAEYIESRVRTDFKGDDILHVPLDWSRQNIDIEAAYRFSSSLRLKLFAGVKSYDYDQYVDTDANTSRDSGSRAVSGTDDDFFGLTATFAHGGWLSGRATYKIADRTFDGVYTGGFSGELSTTRQWDIADRERDAGDLQLDFMPNDRVSIGLGYRMADDKYPNSEYGRQAAESMGMNVNLNVAASEDLHFFGYVDMSEWDVDMHLRTKCSNCSLPPGSSPWMVPNYDWFSGYTDETMAYGVGLEWSAGERTDVNLTLNYVDGEIVQTTVNPGTPVELNPANPLFGTTANVALGFDFPTQNNDFTSAELEVDHTFSDKLGLGFRWRYDDFMLDDFQWNGLQPYGANVLTVDDATRFLFLDSRYASYDASVFGVFLRLSL